MRRTALVCAVLIALAWPGAPARSHAPPSVGGFEFPESVWWDGETGSFYVTNLGGSSFDPAGREEDGFLSQVSGEGRLVAHRWVTGLRSPKGMRRAGDALYVADAGQVVVIDVAGAAIRSTIGLDAIGAEFPNDVAVDGRNGDVYVSDTLGDAIYRLPGGAGPPEVFLESPDLDAPNGLLVDGDRLLVASSGEGRVLVVELATRTVTPLPGMAPGGRLDGIEKLGDAFLVTDHGGGRLLRVGPDGSVTEIAADLPGAADLGLRSGDRVAAVPLLRDGVVRFIRG